MKLYSLTSLSKQQNITVHNDIMKNLEMAAQNVLVNMPSGDVTLFYKHRI
jgi:hypothetical protein